MQKQMRLGDLQKQKSKILVLQTLRNTSLLKFMKMTMPLMEFSKSSVKSPTYVGSMPPRFGLGVVWGGQKKRRLE